MYFKPKYTLKPKYSFWNLSLLQGLPSLLIYLFLAYPSPNFTPKWISGPITVASIWITTVGCGKCCFFFFFFPLRLYYFLWLVLGFPGGSDVKNLPAMLETRVWSTGQEGLLEEEMATHSSIPAWIIPWLEEPRRVYSPWGCKELNMIEGVTLSLFTLISFGPHIFLVILVLYFMLKDI